jgi:hypothetical protein
MSEVNYGKGRARSVIWEFRKMTRSMLRGIRVSSKEELMERISQYIEAMNETPTIFKWKYKMDKMAGGIVVDNDRGVLIC